MEASSLEEINRMISLDPAVTNKVFAYDIRPWSLIAGERLHPARQKLTVRPFPHAFQAHIVFDKFQIPETPVGRL